MFEISDSISAYGKYLRELRKNKGLTLKELGKQAGLSYSYLSQLERGERGTEGIPSPQILKKLAEPLGVSHNELMLEAGYISVDDVNYHFEARRFLDELLKKISFIKEKLMDKGEFKNWYKREIIAILSQEGFVNTTPEEFMVKVEEMTALMIEAHKAGDSLERLKPEYSSTIRAFNRLMILARRPASPLLGELEKKGINYGQTGVTPIGQIMYRVDTQDEVDNINALNDNQKEVIKLYAYNRELIEELLRIWPAGIDGFWNRNKDIFDNRELTIELLDELIKTRPDDSVVDLVNFLFDWSKRYTILEHNGEETHEYTKSQWNELTNYLERSEITYGGQPLEPEDRQRILDMLKLLFSDRKGEQ